MTNWQWKILIALVRYVLRKEGCLDLGERYNQEHTEESDISILLEAAVRDANE